MVQPCKNVCFKRFGFHFNSNAFNKTAESHCSFGCLGSSQLLNGSVVSTGARVWWRALQCSSLFCQHFLKISRHSRVCTKQMATYPSPPGPSDSEVCNQCSVLTFLRPFIHINAAMENWWRKRKDRGLWFGPSHKF